MMYFCTLFDHNYISKGIALYLSLEQHTDDFLIYVMAMSRKCEEMLNNMHFKNMIVECIDDNMSPELEIAKSNRSVAEYCWTCGSYVTDLFLHKYNLPDITYLDSDLMFFSSPKVIYEELKSANASIGLSPHYVPYNASGKYCVQYIYFKNDTEGSNALRWWRDECLKWCYSKIEDGKYGDQLYLNYIPEKYKFVHDIRNRGTGIAYWNADYYNFFDGFLIYKGIKYPYIFYHFSGFNIFEKENVLNVSQSYIINDKVKRYFLTPYIELLTIVFSDYLNTPIIRICHYKRYSKIKAIIAFLTRHIITHNWYRKLVSLYILKKYSVRHSPYSER